MGDTTRLFVPDSLSVSEISGSLRDVFGDAVSVQISTDEIAGFEVDSPRCLVRLYSLQAYSRESILASDPLYRRIGDRALAMRCFSVPERNIEWLRLFLVALAYRLANVGEDLWLLWDDYCAMSGAILRTCVAENPNFFWRTHSAALGLREREAIFGASPPVGSHVDSVRRALHADAESSYRDVLRTIVPSLPPLTVCPEAAKHCSIFLLSEQDSEPQPLEDFMTIAAQFPSAPIECGFTLEILEEFYAYSSLSAATGYLGPALASPIVILRHGVEWEWQGEGAEAIAKLRALAEGASSRGR